MPECSCRQQPTRLVLVGQACTANATAYQSYLARHNILLAVVGQARLRTDVLVDSYCPQPRPKWLSGSRSSAVLLTALPGLRSFALSVQALFIIRYVQQQTAHRARLHALSPCMRSLWGGSAPVAVATTQVMAKCS